MSEFKRSGRVAAQVQSAIADILLGELRDPRITPVTLTSVRLSDDLRVARVNFSPLGGQGDSTTILAGLNAAKGLIRRELGRRLSLKYLPELVFHPDENLEKALRVTDILDQLSAGGQGDEFDEDAEEDDLHEDETDKVLP